MRAPSDEDQGRAEQRPRRQPEHGGEELAVPAPDGRVERQMRRADDEEGGAEEHAVVAERTGHRECRDEHRDHRGEQRHADDGLLWVDRARQPRVRAPRPPEHGEHEHAAADPAERRVVGEQRRHLREREHEHEVEEELSRRDVLAYCRRGHVSRP